MRYKDFCNKDNEIHFLKFVIDKAWHLIQKEAEHQQPISTAKKEIQKAKDRNKVLTSRMTKKGPIDYSATRPLTKNKPKLY